MAFLGVHVVPPVSCYGDMSRVYHELSNPWVCNADLLRAASFKEYFLILPIAFGATENS